MKTTLRLAIVSWMLLSAEQAAFAEVKASAIEITRNAAQPSMKGPDANFVGAVRVDPLLVSHGPDSRVSVASVTSSLAPARPGIPIRPGRP